MIDTRQDFEETATPFTVSESSHNSEKKAANPRNKIQENVPIEAVSFRRIATVEQLQLEQTHA